MNKPQETLYVTILDREYGVSCPTEEVDELKSSARLLDERMREIRKSGKTVGIERIAVMAALNFAHELIRARNALSTYDHFTEQHLARLNDKIEKALAAARQMEL